MIRFSFRMLLAVAFAGVLLPAIASAAPTPMLVTALWVTIAVQSPHGRTATARFRSGRAGSARTRRVSSAA